MNGKFMIAANKEVSFQVSRYDHTRELVIDPVLVYSSFLGGSSQQSVINGMTMNAAGEIYVTGITNAVDYGTTPGVIEESCPAPMTGGAKCGASSASAAFVSKISADGQSLIYSTYLGGGGSGPGVGGSKYSVGGSGADFGTGIAVDSSDNAWVVGSTNSNNFPVTPDAYSLYCEPAAASFDFNTVQNVGELSSCARFNGGGEYIYSGTYSLFLVQLDPMGANILYGTFLGGTQGESQGQIAIDVQGNIVVSGSAYTGAVGTPAATGQYTYPTTASAFQATAQPNAWSAFVTELSPDGHSLLYSSFLLGHCRPDLWRCFDHRRWENLHRRLHPIPHPPDYPGRPFQHLPRECNAMPQQRLCSRVRSDLVRRGIAGVLHLFEWLERLDLWHSS